MASERIAELDGLRGIAVLSVVAWHYLDVKSSAWLVPFRLGWTGVDLFFVLSGFLIGGILLDNRNRHSYFKPFYGRRIHRIFPLYYAWLIIVLLLRLPAAAPHWSYAAFLQNIFQGTHPDWDSPWIGHTWSLAIEEQFYLLAPLAIRFIPWRILPWVGAGAMLGAPLCRWLAPQSWPLAAYMMTPCRVDALVCGVAVAALVRQPEAVAWLAERRRWLGIAAGVAGLSMVYLMLHFRSTQTLGPLWYSVIALAYGLALLNCVVEPPALVSRILCSPVLQRAGALSFAIYILHLPLLIAMRSYAGGLLVPVVAAVATWGLAEFSAEYLEGPFLRRGRRKYQYA
jgi:peptidoglycan/LPS O-acetylase OafA/YrhL